MKKILIGVITAILILSFSLTAFAAPTITKVFVDENGDMYFFGTFDSGAKTAGLMVTTKDGNAWYPIHTSNFYKANTYGRKFGICLKDPEGKLAANGTFKVKAWEIDKFGGDVTGEEINIDPSNNPATVVERDVIFTNLYGAGTALEGFSNDIKEYNVTLPAGYLTYPDITADTNKKATDVEITYSDFNGDAPKATITATNGELEPNVFTINFTKTPAAVTDAKINVDNILNLTNKTALKNENNVNVRTDKLKAPTETSSTAVWYNRTDIYYQEFPDELLGATAVQVRRGLNEEFPADNSLSAYGDMMEFKINHTADVYVHIDNPGNFSWLTANGFAPSDVTVQRWNSNIQMYKKTVVVEPGTTETISIGYFKGTTSEPSILVKFRDTLPEASGMIENAKIYKTSDDSYKADVTVLKNIQQVSFKDPTLEGTDLYAASNLVGAVKPFRGRDYYLYNSPMLNGSDYLKLGYTWADVTGSSSESYYCTFDLTESATIYVNMWNVPGNRDRLYAANPWLSGYDWIYEDEGFETGLIKDNKLDTKEFGFVKSVEVEKGKEVKTIKVGPFINPTNANDQYTFPMIYIKPLD